MEIQYKPTKESDSKTISVDLVIADLPEETLVALAEDAAVVRIQARMRIHESKIADGKEDVLPTDWADFLKPKARLTAKEKVVKALAGFTKEELAKMLKEAMKG